MLKLSIINTMESVLVHKFTVGLGDADFMKTLKISSLFGYFQDIASIHAESLGAGFDNISAHHNVTWVLVKIKVEIDRLPLWNEEITIETWPQKPKRIEFERDYLVKDSNGNIIIRAVSNWVLVDIDTREIRKADILSFDIEEYREERALEGKITKNKPINEPVEIYRKKIGYSDLDLNEHLNNSKYIDYMMDCFSFESHKKYRVKSIQVSYINEALPGHTIILLNDRTGIDNNTVYVEGKDQDSGNQIFTSLIEIEERKRV